MAELRVRRVQLTEESMCDTLQWEMKLVSKEPKCRNHVPSRALMWGITVAVFLSTGLFVLYKGGIMLLILAWGEGHVTLDGCILCLL